MHKTIGIPFFGSQDSYPDVAAGLAALCLFIHQNLDAIDGKHARRTMNYSSVGELFDQVCGYTYHL